MIWVVWLAALLLVLIFGFFVWALCMAAKRGDEIVDRSEYDRGWGPRP